MAKHLIVTGAFGSYQRGDQITDPAEAEAALQDHRAHVVPIDASDLEPALTLQPALAATPEPKAAADDPGALA